MVGSLVHNPVKVAVGVLLVGLFGVIALLRMPMQLTPEVETPTLTIETRWPGASPQEIEREIVQEQEEQLKGVEGLVKLSSECLDSTGRIILEFLVGTDMSEALLKVNTRLQQVREYPEDADEPVITTSNSGNTPIAWFILRPKTPDPEDFDAFVARHPDLKQALAPVRNAHNTGLLLRRLEKVAAEHPEAKELLPPPIEVAKLQRFTEDVIEARFERVAGVSNSNVFGGVEDELQVVVDPERLAARQLTIQDLRAALRGRNRDTSGADFWEGKRRYVVRTLGRFDSPEQVRSLIVASRGDVEVRLGDVAEVRFGWKKPQGVVRNFGTTSIAVNCIRATGANVLDAMEGLRAACAELNEGPLRARGLRLEQVYDETEYIYSAVGIVQDNIVYGGILTILTLLLFLRSGRSTLVIALAIPTSIIGTFLILSLLGRSLNVISLAGLAFAVGMLVDNAIVVLENIYRRWQAGERPFEAAVRGTTEVWGAVVASTLTTLAVFLPVLFVKEEAGQLFKDIALAISASVGLSMVVSAVVIPVATARVLRTPKERGVVSRLLAPVDALASFFVRATVGTNAWLQRGALRQLLLVVAVVSLSAFGTWRLLPKVEYLPTGNRNLVFGILLPPPGYNIDQLLEMGSNIEEKLRPYWDVDPGSPEIGKLPFPAIRDFFYVAAGRQVFVGLRAIDPLRAAGLVGLVQSVSAGIPGTFAIASQSSIFEQGLTAGRTIDIEITGAELPRLVELGGRVFGQARTVVPGSQVIPKPSLDLSNPEVHVLPRWRTGADLGVSASDLGYTVDALVDGAYAADYYLEGDKIDLVIRGREGAASRLQDLGQLPVATASGALVPLSTLADIRLGSGPEQINRRERQRTITIQVKPPPEMPLEDAMDRIRAEIVEPLEREGALRAGVSIQLAGTADKLRATWKALSFNVVLALLITYLLMAALFESWLYPLIIILIVPLGSIGGVLGLRLLNWYVLQPLDVVTMLGFVILIGTVVNNPILIVHQSLLHMREEGMPSGKAILESVRTRMRPIFMTTMTTILGLLPLVLFPGAGSELYRGLGAVLLGGLAVSTFFTLVVVPTVFHLALRLTRAGREERSTAR